MNDYVNLKDQYYKSQIKTLNKSLNAKTHKICLPSIIKTTQNSSSLSNHQNYKHYYKTLPEEQCQNQNQKQIQKHQFNKRKVSQASGKKSHQQIFSTLNMNNRSIIQLQEDEIVRRQLIKSKIKKNIQMKIQNLIKNSTLSNTNLKKSKQKQKEIHQISIKQSQILGKRCVEIDIKKINNNIIGKSSVQEKNNDKLQTPNKIKKMRKDLKTLIDNQTKKQSIIGKRKSILTRNPKINNNINLKQSVSQQKQIYMSQIQNKVLNSSYKIKSKNKLKKIVYQSQNYINIYKIDKNIHKDLQKLENSFTIKHSKKRQRFPSSLHRHQNLCQYYQIQSNFVKQADILIQPWVLTTPQQSIQQLS